MTSVDTNVVVRLLTGDDPEQTEIARLLLERGSIWIAKTVLLETAWVLKSQYQFNEGAIRGAFINLLGLENVHAEDEAAVMNALELTAAGVDFADAMHLSSRPPGASFVSFDQSFVRRAKRAGATDVSGLP